MSTSKSASRRSTISVAALLGAAALLFSGVAPVSATTNNAPQIDPQATGSITIHKLAQSGESGDADHQGEQLDLSGTPLEGVEFTITNLGVEPSTSAGWQEVEELRTMSPDLLVEQGDARPSDSRFSVTTNASGMASTDSVKELPVGVYLVEETDSGPHDTVEPVAPFLVSLPTAGPDNEWLYDVHAYPKNSVVSLDMVADDSTAFGMNGTGNINWEIISAVPYLPAGKTLNTFQIKVDVTDRLALSEDVEENIQLEVGGQLVPLGTYSAEVNEQGILTVSPPQGAGALNQYQGQNVRLIIATKMTQNEDRAGVVQAKATVHVNTDDTTSETKPAVAESEWGAVKVITRADRSAPLEGATYEVRRTQDGPAIRVGTETSFTTGSNGELLIPGLRAGEQFWLVEIDTPRGYTAAPAKQFTVQTADLATVRPSEDHPNVIIFENQQVSGFALPITGSFGSLPFLIGGLLLVAIALIVNRSRRRRLAQAV